MVKYSADFESALLKRNPYAAAQMNVLLEKRELLTCMCMLFLPANERFR